MSFASRLAGDFSEPAAAPWRTLCPVPCTWLRQVHGQQVVVVPQPGALAGAEADAAVSTCAGAGLAVLTADCAPVALASAEGAFGVVHAGWRGLSAGVVEAAVAAMEELGAKRVFAALGPCIWPHAYEFSPGDLDAVAAKYGPGVRAVSASGAEALDLPGAVASALERSGALLLSVAQVCTHCSPVHWSWRAGRAAGRQATVVWR